MLLRRCIDNLEALHPAHAATERSAHSSGDDALEEFLDEDDLEPPWNPSTS
jgi:hypothetical protein